MSQWAPTTKILEIFFHDVLWGFRFVYVVIDSEKDLGNVDFLMELQFPVYFNLMMTFPYLKRNDPWMIISQLIITIIGQCLRHRFLFFPLILWYFIITYLPWSPTSPLAIVLSYLSLTEVPQNAAMVMSGWLIIDYYRSYQLSGWLMINVYHIQDKTFKGPILVDTYFKYLEYHDTMIAQL